MYRILLADDHPIITNGLKVYLEQRGHVVISVCSNGIEAFNQIIVKQPNIAIVDIGIQGLNGIEILQKIAENKMPTKIILYTMQNELSILKHACSLGVSGFVLKELPLEELAICIEEVGRGKKYFPKIMESKMYIDADEHTMNNDTEKLTIAEKKILQLVAFQKSSKEIAKELFITEKTVEVHRRNIVKKLNLPTGNNVLSNWAVKNWK